MAILKLGKEIVRAKKLPVIEALHNDKKFHFTKKIYQA